jgi:hypothetical protein
LASKKKSSQIKNGILSKSSANSDNQNLNR